MFIVIHHQMELLSYINLSVQYTLNSRNAPQAVTHSILSIYSLRVHNTDTHVLHQNYFFIGCQI
jgi:hypothetical protein